MAKSGRPAKPRTATIGDNQMSDDQRYHLTDQHRQKYEILIEAKKRAVKALTDFGKIIKADLGDGGLDDIKDIIALSTPEGESRVKVEMERRARVLRWMNMPIGTQGGLFESDRRPVTERAFAEGRRQGLAGESRNNPHHETTEAARSHDAGYAEGQTVLAADGFKPLEKDEWLRRTREQNEQVSQAIKNDAIDSLTQN